jgi:putative restriction endonuclease
MIEGQRLWTRDELILAINLYCKLQFGRLHRLNPEVIKLAELIERTPNSVAYKLVNFASFDSSLQARGIKGATNTSKLDKEIWNQFYNDWELMPYESERLRAKFENSTIESINNISDSELPRTGMERDRVVKTRVNQTFFRKSIMAAYNNTCCITGISQSEFLIAGHIRPWGIDEKNRLNPHNGILLNALHDKAFEYGYITITPEYKVRVSSILLKQKKHQSTDYFKKYHNREIFLPSRFLPDREFLECHNQERFKE